MNSATLDINSMVDSDEGGLQYRAVHPLAIIGPVVALFTSMFTLLAADNWPAVLVVAFLNAAPLVLCWIAVSRIREAPEEYTGGPLALVGIVLSLLFLIGAPAYGGYVYATEVPDGYTRITFHGMKPDAVQERNGVIVPPDIAALDGQKVFIRGYIRPDSVTVSRGIDRFLLVRDSNECCFGDISTVKYYDQIDVTMAGALRVDYAARIFRVGGILRIEPQNHDRATSAPVFSLRADYAR